MSSPHGDAEFVRLLVDSASPTSSGIKCARVLPRSPLARTSELEFSTPSVDCRWLFGLGSNDVVTPAALLPPRLDARECISSTSGRAPTFYSHRENDLLTFYHTSRQRGTSCASTSGTRTDPSRIRLFGSRNSGESRCNAVCRCPCSNWARQAILMSAGGCRAHVFRGHSALEGRHTSTSFVKRAALA